MPARLFVLRIERTSAAQMLLLLQSFAARASDMRWVSAAFASVLSLAESA